MKIPKWINVKHTTRLFFNQYKYKIVLVCSAAHYFRGNNLDYAKESLENIKQGKLTPYNGWSKHLQDPQEIEYSEDLIKILSKMSDYNLRVESPLLSFYTNNEKDAETVVKHSQLKVKYISIPERVSESKLETNKVITKKIDFEFKVTMGRTRDSFESFIDWCKDNPKVRMPKRASRDLMKKHSWGGYYFYVKDAKTLTLVKLFVGSYINKIENVEKV